MSKSSLHLRLSAAATVSILVALSLSGFFLMVLFERHVTRRVDQELSVYIKQLAATLEIAPDGALTLVGDLADPRFKRPLSGLYWQIETDTAVVLRSRSLWAQSLALPAFDPKIRAPLRHILVGPDGEQLVARARSIFLETSSGERALRIATAVNKAEIVSARMAFVRDLILALGLLAIALVGASWLQIFVGLRPLKQIRQRINDVRTGTTASLEGTFPEEVQLLVGEVNALLSANDRAVQRARDSAADLAHGLKTPLAVLQAESRSLADQHQKDAAEEINSQVENMRQRVERHLAHVRMRGPGSGRVGQTAARTGFEKVIKAMTYMPNGENIAWQLEVAEELTVPLDAQDFFEVFGNLLDNARKFANSKVRISANESEDCVIIAIEDDGPGVPDDKIAGILTRGGRLDEQKTGAGLGLAIAQKILEAYGGKLRLENKNAGGGGGLCISIACPKTPVES